MINIYDYRESKRIAHLESSQDCVKRIVFHHTLPIFLSGGLDCTIRIWDYKSKEQLVCLSDEKGAIYGANIHPEKNLIVSCSFPSIIKLWNFDKLAQKMVSESEEKITNDDVQLVKNIIYEGTFLNWISFHSHSEFILSCDHDNIYIWNITGDDLTVVKNVQSDEKGFECVEAHPKTGQIISCSQEGEFNVWEDSGNCIGTYTTNNEKQWTLNCHKNLPRVAIGTDNSLLILALNKPKNNISSNL